MTATDTQPAPPERSRFGRWIRWPGQALRNLVLILASAWASMVIYYSNLPWPAGRLILAVAFGVFAICAIWVVRRRSWRWTLAGVFAGVVIWFACIPPSNDRPWRTEVARPPRAVIEGDRVRFLNYRNFNYRSRDDFDARYEEREVDMSRLVSLDLLVSYWKLGPVAHTFVSFNFDDGSPPVCISIETRPEIGEGFDPIASLFKQFELVYVVGDERDIIGLRASHRGEDVFLYPLRTTPEGARRLFGVYLDRINELADRAEFYHLLKNNCTLNIVRYANTAGRSRGFDPRHLINGWFDRYLYEAGWVDTTVPFAELRRRSRITDAAKAAEHAPDFSARIRAPLTP